jgi:hypothetical protein
MYNRRDQNQHDSGNISCSEVQYASCQQRGLTTQRGKDVIEHSCTLHVHCMSTASGKRLTAQFTTTSATLRAITTKSATHDVQAASCQRQETHKLA